MERRIVALTNSPLSDLPVVAGVGIAPSKGLNRELNSRVVGAVGAFLLAVVVLLCAGGSGGGCVVAVLLLALAAFLGVRRGGSRRKPNATEVADGKNQP
jgi:p-aminobenzoyl-glutamate transporter AbgT